MAGKEERKYRLLILDDSKTAAAVFGLSFKVQGFDVVCAGTVKEYEEAMVNHCPEVVIFDVNLNDEENRTGDELAGSLILVNNAPVVAIMSGMKPLELRILARRTGVCHICKSEFDSEGRIEDTVDIFKTLARERERGELTSAREILNRFIGLSMKMRPGWEGSVRSVRPSANSGPIRMPSLVDDLADSFRAISERAKMVEDKRRRAARSTSSGR